MAPPIVGLLMPIRSIASAHVRHAEALSCCIVLASTLFCQAAHADDFSSLYRRCEQADDVACKQLELSCSEAHPSDCYDLATMYQDGLNDQSGLKPWDGSITYSISSLNQLRDKDKNRERARRYFDISCRHGNGHACTSLGLEFANSLTDASPSLEKGCNLGVAHACTKLVGLGLSRDAAARMRFLTKACDGHDADGCYNLGYERRWAHDEAGADALWLKACQMGSVDACHQLATMVIMGKWKPPGGMDGLALAAAACKAGRSGHPGQEECLYVNHEFEKACRSGSDDECWRSAVIVASDKVDIFEQEIASLSLACGRGEAQSCYDVAILADAAPPRMADSDPSMFTGVLPFIQACEGGLLKGCYEAAKYLSGDRIQTSTPIDKPRARQFLDRACQGGFTHACEALKKMGAH